ncbi:MAG: glycosyltransferase [Deltaproteobacteria bacterium]|nr:glycosyltransferase [Deltaproteobacteria bacterium]
MNSLYLMMILISTAWSIAGVFAVRRVRRRSRLGVLPGGLEGVSVLKPLCGADESLESNLRGFFEQQHGDFELIFGVRGASDPAIDVVRALRDEFPKVNCRVVIHDGRRGANPKVANLRAMVQLAGHDVLLISDSNVRVRADYVRRMQSELMEPRTGLVTSLIVGHGERSLGALLEGLHLTGSVAPSIALATELGHPAVIGKSMMFRRSVFDGLGGFESVAHVLAEDYVIGRMFDAAGYRVVLASEPVQNVTTRTSVSGFVRRQMRWTMMRVRLVPGAYALEPLTIPLLVACLAPLFGVSLAWPLLWAVALTSGRDASSWVLLRGRPGLARALPLFALRDALMLFVWLAAPLRKHVSWRDNRVRVSAGSRLYAREQVEPAGELLVEG